MSFRVKQGSNFAPAYTVSGIPYVTASVINEVSPAFNDATSNDPIKVSFPFVTRDVTIRNTGANDLRVGFSVRGMFAPGEHQPTSMSGGAKGTAAATDHRNYFIIHSSGSSPALHPIVPFSMDASRSTVNSFNIRCTDIYFTSDTTCASGDLTNDHKTSFHIVAGLTTIPRGNFPTLTGSLDGEAQFEGVG